MNTARLSFILSRYLFNHAAVRVVLAIASVTAIFALIDIAELFRRASNKEDISALTLLAMEALKMTSSLPAFIPFGVLIGLILSFNKLRSSNEIIIARTNGISMLKLAIPASIFVVVLSVFSLVVIDPIASATKKRYLNVEKEVFGGNGRNLTVSTEGIWLRDRNSSLTMIIHGDSLDTSSVGLLNPLVYTFDANNVLISRYYPEQLVLKQGYWQINGGQVIGQDGRIETLTTAQISSSLSQRDLTHSNKHPETIPLFELWGYIDVLEQAGLPSAGHASYLYYKLSTPMVFLGMVFIVISLTLRSTNAAGWKHLILFTLVIGLLFHFVKELLYVMGSSGRLHPIIAGSAAGIVMMGLGGIGLIRTDEN